MPSRPGWLIAAPAFFLLFWSGGFVFAKLGLQYAEPLTFLALRFAIVVAAMGAVFVVLRPPLPKTAADWGHLAIVGVLMQSLYFGFTYLAFDWDVSAGTVALILAFHPILVAIIAPWSAGERIGWQSWAGLLLALAGTVVVIAARLETSVPPVAGLIATAVALAAFLAATLWEKRYGRNHHPVSSNLIQFSAGLLAILPFSLLLETGQVAWNWEIGLALAYLVICNSLIATSLLLAMIRFGEVARVSALLFLVPPGAAFLAWLILAESMPVLAWGGMALAAGGVFIATRRGS
ncbi:MAG: DMT family transporter [Pseudomonadota bacterium]